MNHQNGWTESSGGPVRPGRERRAGRESGANPRGRLPETAEGEFAGKSLRGKATAALTGRAGISEPLLSAQCESRNRLLKEAVERGIERRLRLLEAGFSKLSEGTLVECVEGIADATVAVCIAGATNAGLTARALLDIPQEAIELHRQEAGGVCLLWEQRLSECIPDRRSRTLMSMHVVPYSVQACIAYGFWLAALGHSPASAAPLVRQFAKGVALAAARIMAPGSE